MKKKPYKPRHEIEAAEPRLLFSAGLEGVLAAQTLDEPQPAGETTVIEQTLNLPASVDGASVADESGLELIFIDSDTPEYQALLDDLLQYPDESTRYEVIVLDNTADGIEQITAALGKYTNLSAVHILSHGGDGVIDLGGSQLDAETLAARAEEISSWSNAFSETADFMIYGCELAATSQGQMLVNSLATLTGTDVAASDDLTGNAALGGDWELEYQTGEIEAEVAISSQTRDSWTGVLAVTTDSSSTGSTTGSNLTVSHTTSGTETLMIVGVSMDAQTGASVTGVTYNGSALSLLGTVQDAGSNVRVELWQMVAPADGIHDVVVSFDQSMTEGGIAGVMTFNGVDQTTPLGSFVSAQGIGTDASVNVSTAVGDMVFSTMGLDGATDDVLNPTAGQTEYWETFQTGTEGAGGTKVATSTSETMSWTFTSNQWSIGAVAIKASTNDAPVNTVPGAQSTAQDTALVFNATNGNAVSIADADAGINEVEITLTATNGTLTLNGGGGLVTVGNEITTNTNATYVQTNPTVAMDASGGYVAVWQSTAQDTDQEGIFAQRYDADGIAVGSTWQVNTEVANDQSYPAIAMDAAGNFVITWQSEAQDQGQGWGIYAQRYSADGTALGGEFLVNTSSKQNNQNYPDIAMDSSGNFVIVWQGDGTGDSNGVFGQRFNNLGVAQGGEFLINTYITDTQWQASVDMNASGEFVVAWSSQIPSSSSWEINAQLFNADGSVNGSEFKVSEAITGSQNRATVVMKDNGEFVIGWVSGDINARLFDASGTALTGDFAVNTTATGAQTKFDLALTDDGGFIATWGSPGQNISMQKFDWSGTAIGAETQVNTTVSSTRVEPTIASNANGDYVVLWRNDFQVPNNGIYAQHYESSGLTFSSGGGVNDSNMTLTGTIDDINSALDGLSFTPTLGYTGLATVTITTDDQGNTGSGGALTDTDVINITVGDVTAPTLVSNTGSNVVEAGTDTITNLELGYDDDLQPATSVAYTVTTSPVNGQLELTTGPGIAITSFTQDDIDNNRVVYVHNGSETLSDSFNFSVDDGNGNTLAGQSFAITVSAVNDAPVNTVPGNQVVDEDTVLVFSTGNGNAIQVGDADSGNSPLRVTLTSTNGTMTLASTTGLGFSTGTGAGDTTMTFSGTIASINAALEGMSFTPTLDYSGSADIQITTEDLGSEIFGYDTVFGSSTVAGVYDKEQLATQVTLAENGTLTTITAYMGGIANKKDIQVALYADAAGEPGSLIVESGKITEAAGDIWVTFDLPDTVLTAGTYWIGLAPGKEATLFYDASGGQARISNFDPVSGFADPWSGTYASNTQRMSVYSSFTPDSAIAQSDSDIINITVNPVNDAPTTTNVSASGNEDATSIAITLTGSDIDGTVDNYVLNGLPSNGTLYTDAGLSIVAATGTDYAATAEALTLYFVPNANWNGSTNFQFVAKDNNGLADATPGTATLTVNAVNDAPTTTNVSASGNEDATSIAITLTGSDIDGTVDNYVLNGLPFNGTLYTDAGLSIVAATGTDYAATAEALTLYFVPNANWNGSTNFQFVAKDNNGLADATPGTATLTVNAVNDAPVMATTGSMDLTSVLQNVLDPAGDLVSAIIDSAGGNRITDIDTGAVEGLAIIGVDDTNGSWQYSTDGGASWLAFGAVTNSTAVVLSDTPNDLIRYVPNTGYYGDINITFRAWDTSDGNPSGTTNVDTGAGGDSSAFSTTTRDASINVQGAAVKLVMSTSEDVGSAYSKPNSGVKGLPTWSEGSIVGMRDPNLAFGENTTDGSFYNMVNFDTFAADSDVDIRGLHYVTSAITIAGPGIVGGSIDLLANDVIFVTESAETLSNAAVGAPAGWANNITTSGGSIYVFRAENPDDYSSGYFREITSGLSATTNAITLVESDTLIGDTTVSAGDFLFTDTISKKNIEWYDTSLDVTNELVDGTDIGIGDSIIGIDLVETGATVGGVALNTGTILITLDIDDTSVGSNSIATKMNDIVAFEFSATSYGSGTAVANASIFFDGDANAKFNTADENLDAFSLIIEGTGGNVPTVLGNSGSALNYTEGGSPVTIDSTITVVDVDSADFATGVISVDITAGGSTGDRLGILNQGTGAGQIGVSSNIITYGGINIASFTGGSSDADPLVITMNANADVVATQALLRNITFSNISGNPATAARTIEFIMTDGDGGVSNTITQSATVTAVSGTTVAVDDHWGLDFDGTDDYVSIADSASLTMTNTVTMEAWIKADPSTNVNRMIINKEGEYEVALFSDGTINWAFANTDPGWTWHNTGYVVPDGVWTHIAVAYDNGTVSTYVNGTLVDTYSGSGPIGDAHVTLNELRIGGRSNNPADKYFDGQIDEVRIWNTVRTQAEIEANLDSNLTGVEAGLAGYWSFFEGAGATVTDLTGNGNAGTLIDGGLGAAGPQWTGYSTDQNTQINITAVNGILSNDIDLDGDALTVTQVNGNAANVGSMFTLPSGAELTVGALGAFIYNPNGVFDYLDVGVTATDTFTYLVDDGNGNTDNATVTITITGTADAPTTNNVSATGNEDDASIAITLTGGDIDGTVDNYVLNGLPANGTLYIDAGLTTVAATATDYAATAEALTLYFVPNANWNGSTNFQFVAKDNNGLVDATPGTATLTVNAVNDAPTTNNVSASGNEDDASIAITLTGGDIDGTVDNYVLNGLPANGTLYIDAGLTTVVATATDYAATAEALTLYFVPNANWNGSTNFQFVAKDNNGLVDDTPGTATLTVNAINDLPVATASTVITNEDTAHTFVTGDFSYTDVEGDALVSVTFNNLNLAGGTLEHSGGTAVTNGMTLTAAQIASLVFTPASDAFGAPQATFDFAVNDADAGVTAAQMDIDVTSVNDAPTTNNVSASGNEDATSIAITLTGGDIDGTVDNYVLNGLPANGTLYIDAGLTTVAATATDYAATAEALTLYFVPNANWNGSTNFQFVAKDNSGLVDATPGTATITVNAVNDAPTTNNVSATGNEDDASIAITLTGGDIDGTVDNYVLNGLPANGTLYIDAGLTTVAATATDYAATAEALTLYFVPNANWNGSTNFQFVAKDNNGLVDATPGTATLTVNAVNDAPVTNNVSATGNEDDASIAITLTGGDIDGTVDNYVLNGLPANGTLYIDAGLTTLAATATDYTASGETLTLYFVPNANWNGSTNFQFVAKDNNSLVDATPGTATLTVNAVNDNPTAVSISNSNVNENTDTSGGYTVGNLTSADPDAGDSHSYTVVGGADMGVFTIGGAGLDELVLTDGALDFETKSSYQVIVRSTDDGSPNLFHDETLTITVNNETGNISGIIFTDEGVTSIGAGVNISMVINGTLQETVTTDGTGSYTFKKEAGAGDAVAIFIDNDPTYQGITVTVADGTDLGAVQVYADHVVVRNDNGGSTSIADMDSALGVYADPDIHYAVVGGNLIANAVGSELLVPAGHTFMPGGDVNSTSIKIEGTAIGGSNTFNIVDNWNSAAGNWFANTSTVNMLGTGTINSAGDTFYNLTTGAAAQVTTLTSDLTVTGVLTIANSTGVLTDSGGGYDITVTGTGTPFVNNGATVTAKNFIYRNPSTVTITAAGGTYNVADSLWIAGTSTGAGTTYQLNGDLLVSGKIDVFATSFGVSILDTLGHNITADGIRVSNSAFQVGFLYARNSTIDINGDVAFVNSVTTNVHLESSSWNVYGNWANTSNFFTGGTSTVTFDGVNQQISGSTAFYNLTKVESTDDGVDSTLIFDNAATQTINGTLTLTGLDADDRINLVSSVPGNQWSINLTASAAHALNYIVVTDSDASGSDPGQLTINPVDSFDGGNNIGWFGASAGDDAYSVDEGSTTNLNISANDSDVDGIDLASIVITSGPANGSIIVNANGTVDYTHNGSETVSDSFTYTINDTLGNVSNTGTVTITVNPVNDAPVFIGLDNTPTYIEGGPAVQLDADATISDSERDALNGGNGDYTASVLNVFRNGGANPEDVFNIQSGGNLTVVANNIYVGGNLMAGFTNTGGQLSLIFANSGTVPTIALVSEVLQAITYSNTNISNPPASVQIDYTINDANTGTQGSGGAGIGNGLINVSITPVNDAPTTNNVSASGNEDDVSIAITLTGGDIDGTVDNYVLSGLPANGTLYIDAGLTTVAATATDYAATAEALTLYFVPNANWNGSTNFQFVAKDNNGLVDATPGTATLTVNAVNDAPTTNNVSATGNEDDASVAITLTGGDIDGTVDNYVLNGLPANGTLYIDAGLTTVAAMATDYAATAEALTLYFVPNANWNGSTNFQFVAKDNNGLVDATPGTATLTVNAVNDVPVATANTVLTNEDTAHTFVTGDFIYTDVEGDSLVSVTFNNLNLAGGTLEHSGGTAVTNGMTLTAAQIATLVYTPASDANGAPLATFDFTVNDADAGVTAAQMDIDVTSVNDAPTTNNVSATGNEDDASIAITLTGGDIDGTVDNFALNGLPANGTLYLDAGLTTIAATATDYAATAEALTLYFIPNANWNGSTNFQFVAKDNNGLVDATPGMATLTVNAVNDVPVATANTVLTNEDTTHTFVTGDFTYTDVEGDSLVSVTFNSLNLAGGTLEHSGGTAVTNGMTLTAAQIATLVYTPATDANGAPLATFDFTVNDADAGVTAAQMDIDVASVNDAPTTNNVSATGNEDATSIAITLTGGDIDGTVDNYVLNGLPANGTLYIDAGLTTVATTATDYAATAEALTLYFVPNANWNGSTNFQFVAKDNNGLVDATPGTATLTVNAVNDAPTASNLNAAETYTEDTALDLTDIVVGDVDSANVTVTLALSDVAAGSLSTATSGAVTSTFVGGVWTASGAVSDVNTLLAGVTFMPALDYNSNFTIATSVDDGVAAAVTGVKAMTGVAVNDTPTMIFPGTVQTVNEDTPLVFSAANGNQIAIGDVDASGGDMLIDFISYNGTLTLNGTAGLTFTIGDGTADTSMRFTGSIAAINAAVDGLVFTPDAEFSGGTNFQMWVNDQGNTGSGGLKQDTRAALISVTPVNDVPVATANTVSTSEDAAYNFTVSDFTYMDVEGDALVSVTFNNLNLAGGMLEHSGGTPVINGMTLTAAQIGSLVYTPAVNANGAPLATFDFTVNDADAGVSSAQMDIDVTPVNDAPTANNDIILAQENSGQTSAAPGLMSNDTDPEGTAGLYVYAVNGSNVDVGSTITLASGAMLTVNADGSTVYSSNGAFEYLNVGDTATDTFTYTISDAGGLTSTATVTVYITGSNDAPVTDNVSTTGNEDATSIPVILTGSDIDGTVDFFRLDGLPANGTLYTDAGLTIAAATGIDYAATGEALTLHFVPNANWNGGTGFQFVARDSSGVLDATAATATITVNPVNDAPVAVNDSYTINEDGGGFLPPMGIMLNDFDIDSGSITAILVSGLSNGTITVNPNGSLWIWPDPNFNGVDSFTYKVNDGSLDSNIATVTITVNPVNDAPTGVVSIDNMNPVAGDMLTASNTLADVDGLSGAISYQWMRDGTPITGATGSTYTTTVADVGTVITVVASYVDDQGTAESVSSSPTGLIDAVNSEEEIPVYSDDPVDDDSGNPDPVIDTQDDDTGTTAAFIPGLQEPGVGEDASVTLMYEVNPYDFKDYDYRDGDVERRFSDHVIKLFDKGAELAIDLSQLIDLVRMQMNEAEQGSVSMIFRTVGGITLSLSAGVVTWLTRGGAIAATMVSSVPVLKGFDPITIMKTRKNKAVDDDDTDSMDDSVDSMFEGLDEKKSEITDDQREIR